MQGLKQDTNKGAHATTTKQLSCGRRLGADEQIYPRALQTAPAAAAAAAACCAGRSSAAGCPTACDRKWAKLGVGSVSFSLVGSVQIGKHIRFGVDYARVSCSIIFL